MKRLPLYATASAVLLSVLSACDSQATDSKTTADGESISMDAAAQLKKSGNLVDAAKMYELLARDSNDVDAELELAALDRKLNKPVDAVEILKDAAKRQPDNDTVQTQLGYALVDAHDYEDAVSIFDKLIQKSPADIQNYNGKGVAFDKAGNHLAAQEVYKQALSISPGTLSVENNLAMSLILNKQYGQAIAVLSKLYNDNPDNKTVRHNLALAHGLNGDKEIAMKLNSKDLSPDQTKENQKYYSYYAQLSHDMSSTGPQTSQIGFSETPKEDKAIPAAPVVKKHKLAKLKPTPTDAPAETAAAPAEPAKPEVAAVTLAKPENTTTQDQAARESELQKELAKELEKGPLKIPAVKTASKLKIIAPKEPKIAKVPEPEAVKARQAPTEPEAPKKPESKVEEPVATTQPLQSPSAGKPAEELGSTQLPTSSEATGDFPSQKRR